MIAVFVMTVVRLFGPVPTASSASRSAVLRAVRVAAISAGAPRLLISVARPSWEPVPYQKRPSLRVKSSGARPRRRCSGPSSKTP